MFSVATYVLLPGVRDEEEIHALKQSLTDDDRKSGGQQQVLPGGARTKLAQEEPSRCHRTVAALEGFPNQPRKSIAIHCLKLLQ